MDIPKQFSAVVPELVWQQDARRVLRGHENGVFFLLKKRSGPLLLCALCGNLPGDSSWKYRVYPECRILRLEDDVAEECIVLGRLLGAPG